MKINYRVHSYHSDQTPTVAKLEDGSDVQATIPCAIAELVPEDARHGTVKLVLTGKQVGEGNELFTPDAAVSITIAAGE